MRFFMPQVLWLLLGCLLLPLVWAFLEKRAQRNLEMFASSAMLSRLLMGQSPLRKKIRFFFLCLGITFTILALARPQMGSREELVKTQGLDVVFMMDVSLSMASEDVIPSRLKKAKHIVRNFLDQFSGDRVGIVAFAGSSFPITPLTTDYDFIKQMIDSLDETTIAHQGTNLGSGIDTSIQLIERGGLSEEDPTVENQVGKVIIVISDGEDTVGGETSRYKTLKEKGIKVYTIGVGSLKGVPIPVRDEKGVLQGYKKDNSGNMVLSKLESTALESLANNSGAKYYVASSAEDEVTEIIDNLKSLSRVEGGQRRVIVYNEIFQIPLALALFFLGIMLLTRERSMQVMTVLFLGFTLGGTEQQALAAKNISEYQENKKGVTAYNSGDFSDASEHFTKAQAANPDSIKNHYNLGTSLLKSGNAAAAISELESSMNDKNSLYAAKGAYNLGRAYEAQGDHEHALQAFQKGLDRLREIPLKDEAQEVAKRIKQALETVAQQKQQSQSQDSKDNKDKQQNQQDQKDQKENEDKKNQQQKQDKKYDIPKNKSQFKAEQLTEQDAKRLLQQIREQDQKTLKNLRRSKTEKGQDEKSGKTW